MSDGLKLGNNQIETKQDRRKAAVGQAWEGVKAVVGFLATAVGQALDRAIPMGASEVAGALIPSSAVVQNLDGQQEPLIGPPKQEEQAQEQSTGIEPPKRHRSEAEVANQSEALAGYMNGYKPPVRTDHNSLYYSKPHSQSHSQSL